MSAEERRRAQQALDVYVPARCSDISQQDGTFHNQFKALGLAPLPCRPLRGLAPLPCRPLRGFAPPPCRPFRGFAPAHECFSPSHWNWYLQPAVVSCMEVALRISLPSAFSQYLCAD